jgi:hypothetical protein
MSTSPALEPVCNDGRLFFNVHHVHQTEQVDGCLDGLDGHPFSMSINAKPHDHKARGHDGHCGHLSKEKSENEIDGEALSERQAIQGEGEGYEW